MAPRNPKPKKQKEATIPKGVHDPWRMGTPEWEPPPSAKKPVGARRSTHDMDWDLQPDKRCMLRLSGVSSALIVKGTDDPKKAAILVLTAVQKSPDLQLALEGEGFIHGPPEETRLRGFFFCSPDYVVTHSSQRPETFTSFVRAFLKLNRTPDGQKQLKQAGIRPLLAG